MYICIYIYIYTHYLIIYAHSLRLAQTRSDSLRLAYISHFRAAVFWKITLKESSTLNSIVRRITFLFVFCFFFCFFYCFSSMLLFYLPNRLIMVLGFVVLRRGLWQGSSNWRDGPHQVELESESAIEPPSCGGEHPTARKYYSTLYFRILPVVLLSHIRTYTLRLIRTSTYIYVLICSHMHMAQQRIHNERLLHASGALQWKEEE